MKQEPTGDIRTPAEGSFQKLSAFLFLSIAVCNSPAGPLDTWMLRDSGTTNDLFAITYANGRFVAVGSATVATSTDGTTWSAQSLPVDGRLSGIAFGNGTYVAVGGSPIITSPDGTNWVRRNFGASSTLHDIVFANGNFVAVGDRGQIWTSRDGASWLNRFSATSSVLMSVAYGNGMFLAVGWEIVTSTNGVDWTKRSSPPTSNAKPDVAFGNGIFVAQGGAGGVYLTSKDGVNWFKRSSTSFTAIPEISFGAGTFVGVGGTQVSASTDGINWDSRNLPTTKQLFGIGYGDGSFIAVGAAGTVLQSGVLVTLTGQFEPDRSGFKLFMTGKTGRAYRLQASTDLSSWTDVFSFTNDQERRELLDTSAINFSRRFYRMVSP